MKTDGGRTGGAGGTNSELCCAAGSVSCSLWCPMTCPDSEVYWSVLYCLEETCGEPPIKPQAYLGTVVMSQEIMVNTMKDPNRTKRVFSDMVESLPGFQIVVIATYRRYYDWIVSLYGEKFKSKIKRKLMRWPGNGGIGIPSVETFAARALKRGPPVPFTDVVTRALQDHPGVNIKIINYHAGDSMETAFFCDAMPGATKVCTRNETSSKGANQAPTHFWYDMLATYSDLPSACSKLFGTSDRYSVLPSVLCSKLFGTSDRECSRPQLWSRPDSHILVSQLSSSTVSPLSERRTYAQLNLP